MTSFESKSRRVFSMPPAARTKCLAATEKRVPESAPTASSFAVRASSVVLIFRTFALR